MIYMIYIYIYIYIYMYVYIHPIYSVLKYSDLEISYYNIV